MDRIQVALAVIQSGSPNISKETYKAADRIIEEYLNPRTGTCTDK